MTHHVRDTENSVSGRCVYSQLCVLLWQDQRHTNWSWMHIEMLLGQHSVLTYNRTVTIPKSMYIIIWDQQQIKNTFLQKNHNSSVSVEACDMKSISHSIIEEGDETSLAFSIFPAQFSCVYLLQWVYMKYLHNSANMLDSWIIELLVLLCACVLICVFVCVVRSQTVLVGRFSLMMSL